MNLTRVHVLPRVLLHLLQTAQGEGLSGGGAAGREAGRLRGDGQHTSPTTSWSGEIGEIGIARGTSVDQREGEALCVCACVERVRPY